MNVKQSTICSTITVLLYSMIVAIVLTLSGCTTKQECPPCVPVVKKCQHPIVKKAELNADKNSSNIQLLHGLVKDRAALMVEVKELRDAINVCGE